MIHIRPYINFNGNAEEAFNFYQSVFGGEFSDFQRYKDLPPNELSIPLPAEAEQKILHIELRINKDYVLMGADMPFWDPQKAEGNRMSVALQIDSKEEAQTIFDKLSSGGKVVMPLEKTFWNAYFGMCDDAFEVKWMINHNLG